MVAMHSMQSKLALRPFQLTVNDWSQSVPQVMHTAIEKGRSCQGFQLFAMPLGGIPWAVAGQTCSARYVFCRLTSRYGAPEGRCGGAPFGSAVRSVTAPIWRSCLDRSDGS